MGRGGRSKKRRKSGGKGSGQGGSFATTRILPPWLFYGVAIGFGILCLILLAWGLLNPPTT